MTAPRIDRGTQEFYEAEAQRYPRIHARPVQRYSAAFEKALMAPHIPLNALCLDVGCGEGRTARALAAEPGRQVVGADFSVEMLRVARACGSLPNLHYCAADAMQLPFADGSFDTVVAVTTLNNVPDLSLALGEMGRVLRPGGTALLLVINRNELAALFRAVYYLPFYLYRWLSGGKPYRSLTFSAQQLRDALPAQWQVERFQGMRMLPDMLPEWPFNFHPVFFPAMTALIDFLAPLDRWLCRHRWFGRFARFHFVVARNPPHA